MVDIQILNQYTLNKRSNEEKEEPFLIENKFHQKLKIILNDIISSYYIRLNSKLPLTIEIETINRCNNNCSFCPINATVDPRYYRVMEGDIIEKIASNLEELEYSGLLALFSNNDPLLDPRIVDLCKLFRQKAKKAHIYIFTNGIKITRDLYLGLFDAGLDELIINNYSDKFEIIKPIENLLNEINLIVDPKIEKYKAKTRITMRRKTEILTNRAGYAPNKKKDFCETFKSFKNSLCALPFIQFVIRASGQVSMCCQDALGKVTLGNVNNESIHEIWNGKNYQDVRIKLRKYGRKSLYLCKQCDASVLFRAILKKQIYGFLPFAKNRLF